MKMRIFIENVLMKVVVLALVLLAIYGINYGIEEMKSNKQRRLKHERWAKEGISPITRSIHCDTVKIDTIR